MRNLFAPHLFLLTFQPVSPQIPEPNEVEVELFLDYNNQFFIDNTDDWSYVVDMEMAYLQIGLEYGLTRWMSVAIDLPFANMGDGVWDSVLNKYHQWFDLPDYGRNRRSENDFAYDIQTNGKSWFKSTKKGLHLLDGNIGFKFNVPSGNYKKELQVGVLGLAKIPIGDKTNGYASGAMGQGIFLLTQENLQSWTIHFDVGLLKNASPQFSNISVVTRPIADLFLGISYQYQRDLALKSQIHYYTSPFAHTAGHQLGEDSIDLAFGFMYRINKLFVWEFALGEELNDRLAPDFTFHTRFRYSGN